jgi:hypothetical protein
MPLIENSSSVEVSVVVRLLNAKQKSATEIHKEVVEVCGKNVISRKQVSVWCNQFKEGRTSLVDAERAGRPTTACAMLSMNVALNNFCSLIVSLN